MASQALKNIFSAEKRITQLVTIVGRVSPIKYTVTDSSGRQFTVSADASDFWPPGASVVVQGERITGSGRRVGNMRRMEV